MTHPVHKATLLDAINTVLSNIGQAPITNLDAPNPMVDIAQNTLNEVSLATQIEGWVFNVEMDYPFTPDSEGEIRIPGNVLRMDFDRFSRVDPVMRRGRLYDKKNHTYKFTAPVKANVTWLFEFEDLPEAFKNYITMRSCNLFAARAVGNTEVSNYTEEDEKLARASMMEYECDQGDWNVFGLPNGQNWYPGSRPGNAVYRY